MTAAAELPRLKIEGVHLLAVAPELVLAVGAMLILIVGAFLKRHAASALAPASIAAAVAAAVFAVLGFGDNVRAFDNTVALDGFASVFKLMLLTGLVLSVLSSQSFLGSEKGPAPEFFALLMFATAGMMLMASATDLILVFLALETFSLALYVLVGFRPRRPDSQEGALKYFLTGSFSSAFFLYGTALLYGATGTTRLIGIADRARVITVVEPEGLLVAGIALLLVGLAFKIGAAPFHMWTPDAYQGAPSVVTGFMAAGSKAAGFAVLLRLFTAVFPSFSWNWRPAMVLLASITMVLGGLVALSQTNLKRILAYSAIAHTGFLLIGVLASNRQGVSGSMFYLTIYTFTVIAAFAVIHAVGGHGDRKVSLDDYRGLAATRPLLAGGLAVVLFSLAGLPPTAGFWAKFEVFSAGWSAGLEPLVVLALLSSAVAAFFYARIIWLMFFDEPGAWASESSDATPVGVGMTLVIGCLVILALGVFPTPLLDLVRDAGLVFR